MTNDEIGKRLRRKAAEMRMYGYLEAAESIEALADELSPPRPDPGVFVYWRFIGGVTWQPGIVYGRIGDDKSHGVIDCHGTYRRFDKIEFQLVRPLTANEVPVTRGYLKSMAHSLQHGQHEQVRQNLLRLYRGEDQEAGR